MRCCKIRLGAADVLENATAGATTDQSSRTEAEGIKRGDDDCQSERETKAVVAAFVFQRRTVSAENNLSGEERGWRITQPGATRYLMQCLRRRLLFNNTHPSR